MCTELGLVLYNIGNFSSVLCIFLCRLILDSILYSLLCFFFISKTSILLLLLLLRRWPIVEMDRHSRIRYRLEGPYYVYFKSSLNKSFNQSSYNIFYSPLMFYSVLLRMLHFAVSITRNIYKKLQCLMS